MPSGSPWNQVVWWGPSTEPQLPLGGGEVRPQTSRIATDRPGPIDLAGAVDVSPVLDTVDQDHRLVFEDLVDDPVVAASGGVQSF